MAKLSARASKILPFNRTENPLYYQSKRILSYAQIHYPCYPWALARKTRSHKSLFLRQNLHTTLGYQQEKPGATKVYFL